VRPFRKPAPSEIALIRYAPERNVGAQEKERERECLRLLLIIGVCAIIGCIISDALGARQRAIGTTVSRREIIRAAFTCSQTFSEWRGGGERDGRLSGEKYKVDPPPSTSRLTHTHLLSSSYQARASVISDIDGYILIRLFAGEHDSSRGGINHSAGPNSVRGRRRLIENKISPRMCRRTSFARSLVSLRTSLQVREARGFPVRCVEPRTRERPEPDWL